MNTINKKYNDYIKISLFMVAFIYAAITTNSNAQFTFTDNLRNNQPSEMVIGGSASFTSGNGDPVGAGWLKLTGTSPKNQSGFAYVNKSFPSNMGLLIDFEYTMWRDQNIEENYSQGGDGFAMFLFDAQYGPGTFKTGFYGGSLGYANVNVTSVQQAGLTGGYLGLGFDAYGNFARNNEGKFGGASGVRPNAITLRGPTTTTNPLDTQSNTNRFLKGVTLTGNAPPFTVSDVLSVAGSATADVLDYNTVTSVRPASFYRRVQLEVVPTTNNRYHIFVRWATSVGGAFRPLLDYVTTDVPPPLLKMGFSAGTGGAVNFHEIRNLLITTPNNLRVSKRANKEILRSIPAGNQANMVTYTIEVVNDTDQAYTNAAFEDIIQDINGNQVSNEVFTISDFTATGFTNTNLTRITEQNKITGTLTIAPNSTGVIQVNGTLHQIPPSNILYNKVSVLPTGSDKDFDLGNNTSVVSTPVIAENVDLMLTKTALTDQKCLDVDNGNSYEINVVNMGASNARYSRTGNNDNNNRNRIVVVKTIPSNVIYDDSATNFIESLTNTSSTAGWTKLSSTSGGVTTITYIARGASNGDQILAGNGTVLNFPIRYTIKAPNSATSFEDKTEVFYRIANGNLAYNGNNIESSYNPPNTNNNVHIETIYRIPTMPTVANNKITYYLNEPAQALSATPLANHTLNWYLNQGGLPSTVAPTPFTTKVGVTRYYVSQSNGNCEGPLNYIDVEVLPICVTPGQPGEAQSFSDVGVLTKPNVTSVNNGVQWPRNVPNGYLVLDGSNGGMVITHMTTAQRNALTPVNGMMIYNTDLRCVQLYRGTSPTVDPTRVGWNCIARGCNEY